MRNPRAGIVSGGVPPLNSGPELDFLPSTIIALDMIGEGGKNMILRSSSWSFQSLLLFPEAHSPSLLPHRHPTGKPHSALEPLPEASLSSYPLAPLSYSLFPTSPESRIFISNKGLSKCLQICSSYWNAMS